MIDQLQTVFASFQKNDVKYVVIGGIAAVLYGVPRATFDLDILIEPSKDNAQRLLDALVEIGFGTARMTKPKSRFLQTSCELTCRHPVPDWSSRMRGSGE